MERPRAAATMEMLRKIETHLNKLHELSERLPNDSDKKEHRRHLGTIMGIMTTEFMMPIIQKYPDLDPDK